MKNPNSPLQIHSRWHHHLHPSIHKHSSSNALPQRIQNLIHPTRAILRSQNQGEQFFWTSRSHRKTRYVHTTPRSSRVRHARVVWQGIGHMSRMEYWNISWWFAILFTIGSIVWVINGFIVFLPFCTTTIHKNDTGGGWTAWLGASIFEIGAIFGVWEAWNRDDAADFGWGVERSSSLWEYKHGVGESDERRDNPTPTSTPTPPSASTSNPDSDTLNPKPIPPKREWKWFSTDPKYFHELGFLAAFIQFWAATIFWISGWTSIPQIQTTIKNKTTTDLLAGIYYTPQVVGGAGFIVASALMMLETQNEWYNPAVLSLGWQVGFWNFIGAIGFTLCGALGYASDVSSGADYQSNLCTFWGGWAFLIGSVLQWYESVNSVSVSVFADGKGEL